MPRAAFSAGGRGWLGRVSSERGVFFEILSRVQDDVGVRGWRSGRWRLGHGDDCYAAYYCDG
jgi:hypothetical protein